MIYHHDDNHVAPTKGASDLDAAKGIGLAVLIGVALAFALFEFVTPCDVAVFHCALAAVKMRPAKQQATVPDELLAKAYPEHLAHWERNRQELLRAISVVRSTARGWVVDLKPQERKQ